MKKRVPHRWRGRGSLTVATLLLSVAVVAPFDQRAHAQAAARLGTPVALPADPPTAPPKPLPVPQAAGAAASVSAALPAFDSVLPPLAERFVDLEMVLTIAGAENPTILIAREAVEASVAELCQARVELLPTLNAGMDFNLHRGNLQSAQGIILEVDRQSLDAGAGAGAVGAGTVAVPGVRLTAHLADAWFDPKTARLAVAGRELDALATRNNVLLGVTNRYFALAGAEALLQAARQSESEGAEIARLTENFARAGQGRQADADRALTQTLLLRSQTQYAQQQVAVAGAELARLLSADPSIRLRVPEGPIPLIQLVDPRTDLETLVQLALRNRPEMGARGADVAAAETRLRKERARPWLPLLTVGYSAGEFGGGSNLSDTNFGHFNGRTDFDIYAVWSLQNLGFGNLAVQRKMRAQLGIAEAERVRLVDRIRREVADAYALSAARRREADVARQQVDRAQRAFQEDLVRTRNLVPGRRSRPIETLRSLTLLATARQALITAVVGYDQAQFQLFVALGQPPSARLSTSPAVP
jgi:outer membrane protein TolC